MGFFGRLLGMDDELDRQPRGGVPRPASAGPGVGLPTSDAQAIERYRYLLRTAPPETLEQAHAEAFAKLTPEQRRAVLGQLTDVAPAAERASVAATSPDDSLALARVATRAELRQPGLMERTLGGGMGFGASLLSSFAMGFVGSMVAQSFMSAIAGFGADPTSEGEDSGSDGDELADNQTSDDDYADDGGDFEI